MSRNQTEDKNDGGVFNLTQQGGITEMKKEIQELEQLLAGTNQVCIYAMVLIIVLFSFVVCVVYCSSCYFIVTYTPAPIL